MFRSVFYLWREKMMRYWIALLVGAALGISGCECLTCSGRRAAPTYPQQGINAYRGQSMTSLFETNGAPNQVQKLADGGVMWIYYTNYQSAGKGEIISYNNASSGTTCTVKIVLRNDMVDNVISNC